MIKNNSKISVIIRTKNEERWIGHAIQSILNLIEKPEIIIVDNHSTDNTLNIARLFKQDFKLNSNKNNNYTNIKIVKIKDYTPGNALNTGVKKAKNNIILIMSAHCELKKIDINKHIKDLKKFVCIFGNQTPLYLGKKITKRYIWSHFEKNSKINMFSKLENRYFIHNAIAIYNKKDLIKTPFDSNLTSKEDRYWANDIIKKRKSCLYDPAHEADHHYTKNGNTWKGIG